MYGTAHSIMVLLFASSFDIKLVFCSVQFDGKKVVSGAYDYLVKVWDPLEGTCLHTLQGHTNRVYSLQVWLNEPLEIHVTCCLLTV